MQSFALSSGPPSGPKNYVFVDEHNRHKRLKVMRACEGCRRRKIKCDSATTNTWPCAACVRLKLQCVPPVGGLDGDEGDDGAVSASQEAIVQHSYMLTHPAPLQQPQVYQQQSIPNQQNQTEAFGYDVYGATYSKPPFEVLDKPYGGYYSSGQHFQEPMTASYQGLSQVVPPQYNESQTSIKQERAGSTPSDNLTAENLMEHLGTLKIDDGGVAPYIRQEKTTGKPDAPVHDPEPEPKIVAAFSTDAGSQIRIPPALMPLEEDALAAFETFFRDVHPYAPVLCRSQFYEQWHNDRSSISPLILEAIFANAGRLSDDPAQGAQWLALANKHEACFLDSPRLTTLQALILLLKARESIPKRGYYYRSWMTIKTAVSMAKDLDLHEHFDIHNAGEVCDSDPFECLTKTRVWQTLLICETMVGAPQGRTDLGVDPDSVDISTQPPHADIDDFEKAITRQFAYFVRNVRNIRFITEISHKLKKKKDWGLEPELIKYNSTFQKWPADLPKDLQITMPQRNAVPDITSHFLGNMHSYFHLAIVMLRRPQLSATQNYGSDGAWKQHMSVSYQSAKVLCRLQEGILQSFDLTGLLCMQRGINFTIYAILTCIMVHLIALSSPDPEYNSEARDYFVRHMRILERCMSAWPMQETEDQINALRSAFSADLSKPFELRESFPLGSPSEQSRLSPSSQASTQTPLQQQSQSQSQSQSQLQSHQQQQQSNSLRDMQQSQPTSNPYLPHHLNTMHGQSSYLATPPFSAHSATDSKPPTPIFPSPYELTDQHNQFPGMSGNAGNFFTSQPAAQPVTDYTWNPTPIIHQFDTAFAIPPSALAPPPSMYGGSGASPPSSLQTPYGQATSSPPIAYPSSHPQSQQTFQTHQIQQQHYFAPATGMPQQGHEANANSSPLSASGVQHGPGNPGSAAVYGNLNNSANPATAHHPSMQFVTPRQWQQSVQSVFEMGGMKRRWDFDQ